MTDTPQNSRTDQNPIGTSQNAPSGTPLRSKVSQKWSLRMVLISVVLIGFGAWGLFDATYAYPNRGSQAAEWFEYQYLDQYKAKHGVLDSRAGISDIPAARADLTRRAALSDPNSLDATEQRWLDSLALIGKTDAATATAIPRDDFRGVRVADANARYAELAKHWNTSAGAAKSPSALSTFDIPVQWVITFAGFGIGLYLILLIVRVRSKVFTFDPITQRLTLPGGSSFAPSDIDDVDKRRWHKLFVDIRIKPGHAGNLAGKVIPLDLLRYEPVEDWVLGMERTAFPDRAAKEEAEAAAAANAEAAPAPTGEPETPQA